MREQMREQILQRIIEEARNGDYQLVSSILSNITERLIYQSIPLELKKQVASNFGGRNLFVVQRIFEDGTDETYETIDEIEAYVQFNEWNRDPKGVLLHKRASIEGGNEFDGWIYSLENAELIQSSYFDAFSVDKKPFHAKVEITIDGTVLKDTQRQYVMDCIAVEIKPIFVSPEFVEVSSVIDKIHLEM